MCQCETYSGMSCQLLELLYCNPDTLQRAYTAARSSPHMARRAVTALLTAVLALSTLSGGEGQAYRPAMRPKRSTAVLGASATWTGGTLSRAPEREPPAQALRESLRGAKPSARAALLPLRRPGGAARALPLRS